MNMIKTNLAAERKKLLDELATIDCRTPKESGEVRKSLLQRRVLVVKSIQETNTKIKEANRIESGSEAYGAIGIALDGLHLLRDMFLHQKALAADCQRRLEIMREMATVAIPSPAIPNDFETWRRECYDRQQEVIQ